MSQPSKNYHHGELRAALLEQAQTVINSGGVDALSLRKMAGSVGVSRTALYHHFKNKNDLLCAIAEQGFSDLFHSKKPKQDQSANDEFQNYIHRYFNFATNNPSLYDLMFGTLIWKQQTATDSLKNTAYQCFNQHLKLIENWQQQGILKNTLPALRVAQVTWGTLHGIAKLVIDGIYVDQKNLQQLGDTVFGLFLQE